MPRTLTDNLDAISLTATAKAAASARGVDLSSMVALAKTAAIDLKTLLRQIVAVHPSTGGDAKNYSALNTIIGELA